MRLVPWYGLIEMQARHRVEAERDIKRPADDKLVEHHTTINDERLTGHIVGVWPGKV